MEFKVRVNTCDNSMGELEIADGASTVKIDYYDREDLAHEFINAYRDLFGNNEDWCKHLSHYLDDDDIKIISLGG